MRPPAACQRSEFGDIGTDRFYVATRAVSPGDAKRPTLRTTSTGSTAAVLKIVRNGTVGFYVVGTGCMHSAFDTTTTSIPVRKESAFLCKVHL
jgi:hypothetical protein